MRRHAVLLLAIALSSPALAVEPKQSGKAIGNSVGQSASGANAPGSSTSANNEVMPVRPARKSRIRQTFPPSAKRM